MTEEEVLKKAVRRLKETIMLCMVAFLAVVVLLSYLWSWDAHRQRRLFDEALRQHKARGEERHRDFVREVKRSVDLMMKTTIDKKFVEVYGGFLREAARMQKEQGPPPKVSRKKGTKKKGTKREGAKPVDSLPAN